MNKFERRIESNINSANRSDTRDQAGSTTDPHKKDDILKQKLKEILLGITDKYRKMKENPSEAFKNEDFIEIEIPVGDDMRLDENKYRDCPGYNHLDINNHRNQIERSEKKWEEKEKYGERLEEIIAILLHKILGDDFIILRTSKHDDYHYRKEYVSSHGESGHWECEGLADIIIFNVKNGDMCVIDAVCPECMPGDKKVDENIKARLGEKISKIFQINKNGGASLEYGLNIASITKIEGGKRVKGKALKPEKRHKIPTFLFTYSKMSTEELIENFNPSLEETSEAEKEAFQILALQMHDQIASLEQHSGFVRQFSGNSFKTIKEIANIDNLTPDEKKKLHKMALR